MFRYFQSAMRIQLPMSLQRIDIEVVRPGRLSGSIGTLLPRSGDLGFQKQRRMSCMIHRANFEAQW